MLSRIAKGVSVGLLSLLAAAPTVATHPKVQEPTTYEASDPLESRLSADLEMARAQPLRFINGLNERYSSDNLETFEEQGKLRTESNYSARMVSNMLSPGVRYMVLHHLDENLDHSTFLQSTIDLASDEGASFLERRNAIDALGYLFERGKTNKNKGEIDTIAETLYDVLHKDLERVSSSEVTSETLPDYLTLQTLKTTQRFLQVHRKSEDCSRLAVEVYLLSVNPSTNPHVAQHGIWVLDSVFKPASPAKLRKSVSSASKKLTKDEKSEAKIPIKDSEKVVDDLFRFLEGHPQTGYVEPRFTYRSDDHLGNLAKRFEKRFSNGYPTVKVSSAEKDFTKIYGSFLEEFKREKPDEYFTFALVTDEIDLGKRRRTGQSSIADQENHIICVTRHSCDAESIKGLIAHEGTHLLTFDLGLKLDRNSHLEEEIPLERHNISIDPSSWNLAEGGDMFHRLSTDWHTK